MSIDFDQLEREVLVAFESAADADALETVRVHYLGGKGLLKQLLASIKDVPGPEKKAFGQRANALKRGVESAFDAAKARLGEGPAKTAPLVDVTRPGRTPHMGRQHVLSGTAREITSILRRLGFRPVEGPEVEDEFHNFEALNIPLGHPARDERDNFFLQHRHAETGAASPAPLLLRSQTSTVQIRALEKYGAPLRIVACGRCYRPDAVDATHHYLFNQVEALAIDKGITLRDLKGVLELFVREYFGADAKFRLRPHYFPFTEVSAEIDISCAALKHLRKEWLEVGGCGMVDPNVLKAVGVDPEVYTGFAWGLGIERMAMLRHQIPDIRHFLENDVRFLRQF